MEFRVLGPLEVCELGRPLDIGSRLPRAVLALLVMNAGGVVSLDRLVGELWGDEPPATATTALQGYISQLRKVLEPGRAPRTPPTLLVTQAPGYVLRVEPGDVDARCFDAEVDEGRRLLATGHPQAAAEVLRRALARWRGRPYAEFTFDPFAQAEIARLEERRAGAADALVEAGLFAGDHEGAAVELERLVADDPLRERRWELLALALYRCGRQAEALRALARARQVLKDELGLEPGPGLRAMEDDILAQAPSLDWQPPAVQPPGDVDIPEEATAPPGLPPLIGRDREVDVLDELLAGATAGHGGVALVSGEPGIGKTRLLEAMGDAASRRGMTVGWGRAYDDGGTTPLAPWMEILGGLVASTGEAELRQALGPGAVHLAQLVPEIKEVAGELPPAPLLTAEAARLRLYEATVSFLVGMAAQRPLLVVVDDLQWADVPSLQLFELLAGACASAPLVVAATYRDSDVRDDHPLVGALAAVARHGTTRLSLSGLGAGEVARVMASATGTEPAPPIAHSVHARTGGNPFFVTELTRLLQSEGRLGGEGSDPGDAEAAAGVPETVRDVIRHRLRRLPEQAVTVLATAAVLGPEFDADVLVAATGLGDEEVFDSLEAGLVTGVLVESTTGIARYRFSHGLVQETLYAQLSGVRRARLHRQAADAVRAIHGDEGDRCIELAHHYWEGRSVGTGPEGLEYATRAAQRALLRFAFEQAQAQLDRARVLTSELPPGPVRSAHELRLHLVSKELLSLTRGYATPELGNVAARAHELARELGDPQELVAPLWGMWAYQCVRGELDAAEELATQLLSMAVHGDDPFALAGHYARGVTAWHRGDQGLARQHLDLAVEACRMGLDPEIAQRLREYVPEVSSLTFCALVRCLRGEDEISRSHIASARRRAETGLDRFALSAALLFDAWCEVVRRDPDAALAPAEEALVVATDHGFGLFVGLAGILAGWAGAHTGPASVAAEALAGMRQALGALQATGARMLGHFLLGLVADVERRAGDSSAALGTTAEALAAGDAIGERFYEAELHRLRGDLLVETRGDRAGAEQAYRRAAELAHAQHATVFERRATAALTDL